MPPDISLIPPFEEPHELPEPTIEDLERDFARVTAERDELLELKKQTLERYLTNAQKKIVAERDQLAAEKAALETRLSYVTTELLKTGVDCGAAPVEELARRVVRKVAELERERDAIQRHLSDGAGKPYFDGSLVEQVMESRREVERERDALERDRDELRARLETMTAQSYIAIAAERDALAEQLGRLKGALEAIQHRVPGHLAHAVARDALLKLLKGGRD